MFMDISAGGLPLTDTDVHQHLWPESLIAALARRRELPLVRRSGSGWVLRLRDEPEYRFDRRDHDPQARRAQLERDGVDRALLAISSPLGIEALPREEAGPLLAAHNRGLLELGPGFGVWGAVALRPPLAGDVDELLDAGAVGVSLPAGALRSRSGIDRCAGVLERLEAHDAPLLIHPGPGPLRIPGREGAIEGAMPSWWPAMTGYVADMNAAWHAFIAFGRPRHPRLRVVFAMLAGGAPLHFERLAARGGPTGGLADAGLFYDTSSYGTRTIDAVVRCVGIDQLVYGSDRPVVSPPASSVLGPAARKAMVAGNVARLLGRKPVVAA
ncbi:MAG: 6-methylsalicylate decarboxylase [Solirubrobacteraceae bacterium]|nr:6-methylsalicylate decarboxylase [Solirubrobacteraceae bacterium]